ncbi:Nicotianamine synthase [Podospora appendiculata]|uniref:Nicotianamine synthase n=1 Tax=Podospora appendiculata TaxID=314037 RepID=A0AAE0WZA3_9PEZI|nr:Nicotianamine synthase [Podospora appendiculata]
MTSFFSFLGLRKSKSKLIKPCHCDSRRSHDSIAIIEKSEVLCAQIEAEGANMGAVQQIVQTIIDTHSALVKLPDLNPGDSINKLLGNLVSVCSEIHDQATVDKVLESARVKAVLPSLRKICAKSESCLESHWARKIVQGNGPEQVISLLRNFPYYENYEELARLELCAILSATKSAPKKIAFIGSGPLPLTSLCLLRALKNVALVNEMSSPTRETFEEPEATVLNIDCDKEAIHISTGLIKALGIPGEGMEFSCADATSPGLGLKEFDVVYVAALVGVSQVEKEEILKNVALKMRKGALMVVRSAWGLRTCLYPEVDITTQKLLQCLEPCVVVHPMGQVVNSVIVAKVRG